MGIIELNGVKKYFKETKALDGVDLDIERGTILGLLGPNGAGKTTLVRIVSTLLQPDSGSVTVAGFDVVRDPIAVRSVIGLAGQSAAVDGPLTGRENLEITGRLYRLSKKEARIRAQETLERLNLTDAADRAVRTYSGGMRRRLDVGASLVGRPTILLLDEPTTGLDPQTRSDLWDFLKELVEQGTTVLLTTQYLDEADQLADKIVVIDHGKVVASGTSDELKHRLGSDVLEFGLSVVDQSERAIEIMRPFATDGPNFNAEEKRVYVSVQDGPKVLLNVIRELDGAHVEVSDVALRRPSLDDVFLTLTGHRASEEVGDEV
jgi:ABC-2 type transport system ATP-binding protein